MPELLQGTFVSEKVAKVRWKHENYSEAKYFLTGSWDNTPNDRITLYGIQPGENNTTYPINISSIAWPGDVTEMRFIGSEQFVASSSKGLVKLMKIQDNPYPEIKESMEWKGLHSFGVSEFAPCTSISTFEQDIATVGEDGRINLLTAHQSKPVRTIDDADSCALNCVDFLRHSEILTGNNRGLMKVWDLRTDKDVPTTSIMLSETTRTEALCITHHPTQKHIVVAGGGDGSLTVWDLRYNTYPTSQLNAHAKGVIEVLFHNDQPDNLFTCSLGGEVWHWNNSQVSKLQLDSMDSHWLNSISGKGKVNVNSVCAQLHKPINSIDVDKHTLLFGCDNEAIYLAQDINL